MKYYPFYFLLSLVLIQCDAVPLSFPSNTTSTSASEVSEYNRLLETDKIDRVDREAKVLNYLLTGDDPSDKYTAIVIDNFSNCNIIMRITGMNKTYNLPIPSQGKNLVVVQKGLYTFRSNVCTAKFTNQKSVQETYIFSVKQR